MFNKIYDKFRRIIKENKKFLVSLVIIIFVFTYELPACIYTPGGKVNLSDRIEVENGYNSKGEFAMTYVSMVKSSLPFVLLSYVIPNWDLQKEQEVTYENMSLEDTIEIDKLYMQEGINNAILSAYKLAGKEVEIKSKKLKVVYVDKNSKSYLKINDEIISVNNQKVSSIDEIQEAIKNASVGDKISVKINRDNKEKIIMSKLISMDGQVKLGIATISLLELDTNPTINIKMKSSESGSSGGLMMALAIYNLLVEEDLTNGDLIAGTGTIDESGNVGEIDGIKYKLIGANQKKADIFLCPKENYEEALKVKKEHNLDIEIIDIETLNEAIKYLESRNENE